MPNPIPAALVATLAHAQECGANACFLDAGRPEHARLAADVQQLVQLVADIRREATGSTPQCINLAGIDRLINSLSQ